MKFTLVLINYFMLSTWGILKSYLSTDEDQTAVNKDVECSTNEEGLIVCREVWQGYATEEVPFHFRIFNNNVRYATKRVGYHEKRWDERKDALVETIKANIFDKPTIITLQEVLANQLKDIEFGLNGHGDSYPWTHFGVGRDDGKNSGEFAPIIYNSAQWNLEYSVQKWISKTPDVPSKYTGAQQKRIITIAVFSHKKTGVGINVINTHFDHRSEDSRDYGADLIIEYANRLLNGYPTMITGDFNSEPGLSVYEKLATQFIDTEEVAETTVNEELVTAPGFDPAKAGNTLDYVFTTNENVRVKKYEIVDTLMNNMFRFSDHRPIVVDFAI